MASKHHRVLNPPAYFLFALILTTSVGLFTPGAMLQSIWITLAGLLLIVLGAWLNVAGSRQFEQAGTPIRPGSSGGTLVTSGVFRFSRNPMYLGMVLALIGAALACHSGLALLVAPLFLLLIDRTFVAMEEPMLQSEFGEQYDAYRRNVRRWL